MMMRVSIARALVTDPKLLMDELRSARRDHPTRNDDLLRCGSNCADGGLCHPLVFNPSFYRNASW
jgi:ABC-type polar amino acid transport system ATPase subunit